MWFFLERKPYLAKLLDEKIVFRSEVVRGLLPQHFDPCPKAVDDPVDLADGPRNSLLNGLNRCATGQE